MCVCQVPVYLCGCAHVCVCVGVWVHGCVCTRGDQHVLQALDVFRVPAQRLADAVGVGRLSRLPDTVITLVRVEPVPVTHSQKSVP
jgi:hypothetical protein